MGTGSERHYIYYPNLEAYQEDLPYIRMVEDREYTIHHKPEHYIIQYREDEHKSIKDNSILVTVAGPGEEMVMVNAFDRFKKVWEQNYPFGHITLPLKVVEIFPYVPYEEKLRIQNEVKEIIKRRR